MEANLLLQANMSHTHHMQRPDEQRSVWKVAARVPWPAVVSVCLYLPGIILWAVYSLRCKASTFVFLSTIAPVSQETVDAVTNTVNTTLITLAAGGTFIFVLLLVFAIARSIQVAGVAPNTSCPCARPTPSSFYLYRVFNMGFNIIVLFVDLAMILLMMGAFLWLVVAIAANVSIKFGVRYAESSGIDPVAQFNLANQNYSTVVSYYEKQLQATPPCVVNTTWFKGLNSSIASILAPAPDATGAANTLLCPQSCLNLGSFATLFKLSSNCICNQAQLYTLQDYSGTISAQAGVALTGAILIYLACCCLHAYLISQYVRAGYDYKAAKQHYAELIKRRRRRQQQQQKGASGSGDCTDGGPGADGAPPNGTAPGSHPKGGVASGQGGYSRDDDTAAAFEHSAVVIGDLDNAEMGYSSGVRRTNSNGRDQNYYYTSPDSYDADRQQQQQQTSHCSSGGAIGAEQPMKLVQLSQIHPCSCYVTGSSDAVASATAAAAGYQQHKRSGSSSSSSTAATGWNGPQQGHHNSRRASAGVSSSTTVASPASVRLGSAPTSSIDGGSAVRGAAPAPPAGWSQEGDVAAPAAAGASLSGGSPPGVVWGPPGTASIMLHGMHSRNQSRSSGGSVREILLGTVSLDQPPQHGNAQDRSTAGAAAASLAVTAAATAAGAPLNNSRMSNARTAPASQSSEANVHLPGLDGAAKDVRRLLGDSGGHHKPSSSSGSYESMIYHSPRNSDCGSNSSTALAGAAAAAGLLDLSPVGLARMQQQWQQQQPWAGLDKSPATIFEGSNEQLASSPAATVAPGKSSAEDVTSAAGAATEGAVTAPADKSSPPGVRAYDTRGSQTSVSSLSGSLTGSSRRSRQSHRRLPAFDLTNIPTNLLTVEGLEEQQELARSASRPCSPELATAAAASATAAATQTAAAATDAAGALEAGSRSEQPLPPPAEAAAADAVGGDDSESVPVDAKHAQQPSAAAGTQQLQQQQQFEASPARQQLQRTLHVRRNITAPAHLQLPGQNELQQQPPAEAVTPAQQRQQRAPFSSPLLPPPEQQQLLLQHQQQQLMRLLQQEQQWQQPTAPSHHRQWSTPSPSSVVVTSGVSSPASFMLQQQHHHHSQSAVDAAASLNTALPPLSSLGFSTAVSQAQSNEIGSLQQQQLQQQLQVASAAAIGGADSTASPTGSSGMYSTPDGSTGLTGSTPLGTPRRVSGLAALMPPQPALQQPTSTHMLPPLYGSSNAYNGGMLSAVAGGGGASSSSSSSVAGAFGIASMGAGSSSSSSSIQGSGLLHTPAGSSTPQSVPTASSSSSVAGGSSLMGSPMRSAVPIATHNANSAAAPGITLAVGGLPPTIPETTAGLSADGGAMLVEPVPGVGATGGVDAGLGAYGVAQQDVPNGSPLERRRSGYRSSLRKGFMAYDQYKHRQRYQEQVSQPLDPRTEISRRYRNRVPAM